MNDDFEWQVANRLLYQLPNDNNTNPKNLLPDASVLGVNPETFALGRAESAPPFAVTHGPTALPDTTDSSKSPMYKLAVEHPGHIQEYLATWHQRVEHKRTKTQAKALNGNTISTNFMFGAADAPDRESDSDYGALGLLLHYLNSTMREITLQQVFALIPTTVSRYITFGLEILLATLRTMPAASVEWPDHDDEFGAYNELIIEHHPRLTGAFASIDGLNLICQTSSDEEIENATYNGWLCDHYVSSVLVFSPKMLLGVGTIRTSPDLSTRSFEIAHPMAFILLPTLPFLVERTKLRAKSEPQSKLGNACRA
ncbi:hypothetical protein B0H16DRAFT_1742261 [Mycena metata]|uniref:Uncharacterized protein n=1 Tax=Mycena metata TaxID=1033252 RepID=A0AAD7MFC5_9AGAR|nr:hypothetical protein B0H16DRAFT_1742261 [Mycena metata]